MSTATSFVCLANSYRPGGHCVAGKQIVRHGFGSWLRPVSLRAGSELSRAECMYGNRAMPPQPLDLIGLALSHPVARKHQRENVAIAAEPWTYLGHLSWERLPALCDHPDSLWINREGTAAGLHNCMSPAEAETADHSLLVIHVPMLTVRVATGRYTRLASYHGAFSYRDVPYVLNITDPALFAAFAGHDDGSYPLPDAYLCISLSHVFSEGDSRCHKLIAGIITNPGL